MVIKTCKCLPRQVPNGQLKKAIFKTKNMSWLKNLPANMAIWISTSFEIVILVVFFGTIKN